MKAEHLLNMANRVAVFFAAMPDETEATEGVATHLRRFWEPRMRRQILAELDAGSGAGMHPLLVRALTERRTDLAA
jgi:formate dehydrogenase subunit delta